MISIALHNVINNINPVAFQVSQSLIGSFDTVTNIFTLVDADPGHAPIVDADTGHAAIIENPN